MIEWGRKSNILNDQEVIWDIYFCRKYKLAENENVNNSLDSTRSSTPLCSNRSSPTGEENIELPVMPNGTLDDELDRDLHVDVS